MSDRCHGCDNYDTFCTCGSGAGQTPRASIVGRPSTSSGIKVESQAEIKFADMQNGPRVLRHEKSGAAPYFAIVKAGDGLHGLTRAEMESLGRLIAAALENKI